MLKDSLSVLRSEARKTGIQPLFDEDDIEAAMRVWKGVEYHENISLDGGLSVTLYDSGHILGSAMVVFARGGRALAVTGDLGNSPAPIVRDTEPLPPVQYLIMESVYGDRNHEHRDERTALLRSVILDTVKKKGTLVIPSFSLERTQDLLFEINNFVESASIPAIPVFMDSPLAIRVTSIYRKYERYYNADVRAIIKKGDDIFKFPHLSFTESREESEAIDKVSGPKIIIAGSGMSNGGRVQRHERLYLPDPNNTILLAGYQVPGSLGRRLLEGEKKVRIFDRDVPVRARIVSLRGYSAHKDMDHLIAFAAEGSKTLETVYVALGEPRSSMFLAQRLRDYVGLDARVPEADQSVTFNV
jgi:metallo-beta-lactamase family protein